MTDWVSSERELIKTIMIHLNKSPLLSGLNNHIYDRAQVDINSNTYVIVGETNIIEHETSNTLVETIAVTAHVYHRNDANPDLTVDETRQFVVMLKRAMMQLEDVELDHYVITDVRLDNQQTITDIDYVTQHGILRIKYDVFHKVRY